MTSTDRAAAAPTIAIPSDLLPQDGRFGSGPTRIRPEQVTYLEASSVTVLGTSHRKAAVRNIVGSIREGFGQFFNLPDGYEVALGNGGASALWDAMTFCVVRDRAQCATFGEFGAKFANALDRAPFTQVDVVDAAPGTIARPDPTAGAAAGVDVYAHPHNETSTGVISPVERIADAGQALTVVDATSASGGVAVDISQTDIYYFSPQKSWGSDGGLWFAILSPAAVARIEELTAQRWVPEFLNMKIALDNSRKDQTLNTPAVATLLMLDSQVRWLNENGGMEFAAKRTAANAEVLYGWADASQYATPFVTDPALRSPVVGTIDLAEDIDHLEVARHLRDNGIVDIEPYRKLGRNQLRVGMFPSVQASDVAALTACIDYVAERL